MKRAIFILIFIFSTSLFGQNINDKIKGHWAGCNSEIGYNEMVISDSLIYYRHSKVGGLGSHPWPYKYDNNNLVILFPENMTDTIHIKTLYKNKIIRTFKNKESDTLYLISKNTPYEDPNIYCQIEMTPRQYGDYLSAEFYKREIKNMHKCVSLFDIDLHYNADNEKIDFEKLFDDLNNDPKSQLPDDFRAVHTDNIDFKIIEKTTEYHEPTLVEFKTNEKNGLSLIIIDYYGRCYDDIDVYFEIKDDYNVDCNIKQSNMSCDDSCKIRLYFILNTINYTVKNITLHDENRK